MVDAITTTVFALFVVYVNTIMNPGSRPFRETEGYHLPIVHPITFRLHTGRDSHHQHWEPVAKGTEVPHLDVARAEVIHHFQVPDHKEEHHSLYQHPEETGKEKVVQEACNDGAAHLERRSMHTQDPPTTLPPPPPQKQVQTIVRVHFDWNSPTTAHSFIPQTFREIFFPTGAIIPLVGGPMVLVCLGPVFPRTCDFQS